MLAHIRLFYDKGVFKNENTTIDTDIYGVQIK